MMKSLKVLTLAAAAALLAAPVASADGVSVKASVPFDFVVADRHLPSGDYLFVARDEPGVVFVYAAASRKHVATVFCRTSAPAAAASGLTFARHGSEMFLKTIRTADGRAVWLPATSAENRAELRARAEAEARARAAAVEAAGAAKSAMP